MIFKELKRKKRSLFGQVLEGLGSRIVRGELQPGQTLPETELCRDLGASRTVVREVLKTLSAKGLVDTRTRTGTRVLEATHWNLLDLDVLGWRYAAMPRMQFFRELFELRRMIEPNAAALAAERATAPDIKAIAMRTLTCRRRRTRASPRSMRISAFTARCSAPRTTSF